VLGDLSLRRTPRWARRQGRFKAATSFVLRAFDDALKVAPNAAQRHWLSKRYPDAVLQTFIKHGGSRQREAKWLGSYRFASSISEARHARMSSGGLPTSAGTSRSSVGAKWNSRRDSSACGPAIKEASPLR